LVNVSSPETVALRAHVEQLRAALIVEKEYYGAYSAADHLRAVAFRVMASALIEGWVEEICRDAASQGIQRLKKGQPTATGRALVVWAISRNIPGCIPILETDAFEERDAMDAALHAYTESVKNSHGISGKDFLRLLNPLGLRPRHIPSDLVDKLQALSERRDPAVHKVVNRAKTLTEPNAEYRAVVDIVSLLESLHAALSEVVVTFPIAYRS
jgi:hypothetical protein